MRDKRIWVSILLTLFTNILCMPLWTECGYGGFLQTLINKEARMDIVYTGVITNDEPFHFQAVPKPFLCPWFYDAGNSDRRLHLSLRARGKWQKISLRIETQRSGKISVILRGPLSIDDHGNFYSVLTDWRNFKINGNIIFDESKELSLRKTFAKQIPVKKNEILHIEADFRRHHFTIHDFTWLKSGMVWYIITGNLFFFFLIYRLLSCIQGGGIRKGDAFLLAVFFLCLFVPMIGISDEVKSVREGRMLTMRPELKDIFKERSDYGRRYESWFNEHFCGRVPLMKLHDILRNKLSYIIRAKRAIYFKENGWDFLLPIVSNLDCSLSFLQSIVQNIVQLNEFCQQNQIKLYVLEVPKKEIIHKELIKENYGFDEKQFIKVSRAQETIRKEVRKHRIPYIYPNKALRNAAKQDFVFFKCSHHWTDRGAFIGYYELMKEITKDFPDVPVVSPNEYRKSQNCLQRDDYPRNYRVPWHFFQFFNDKHLDDHDRTFYTYYDHKNGDKMKVQVGKFTKEFAWLEGGRKVMLIGTSQNENFLQFLPYSAARTKYIRLNAGQVKGSDEFKILKLYKKDILAFKPDILILSIHSDNLPALRNICSTK